MALDSTNVVDVSLSCPNPSVINALEITGFELRIVKIPELSFWIKNANLPSISLNETSQATPFHNVAHVGDKAEMTDLSITFQVDELMNNYVALYDWIRLISFAHSYKDIPTWKSKWYDGNVSNKDDDYALVSDATLIVMGGNSKPIRTITFKDMWISSLGSINVVDDVSETTYVTCDATFKFKDFFDIGEPFNKTVDTSL